MMKEVKSLLMIAKSLVASGVVSIGRWFKRTESIRTAVANAVQNNGYQVDSMLEPSLSLKSTACEFVLIAEQNEKSSTRDIEAEVIVILSNAKIGTVRRGF